MILSKKEYKSTRQQDNRTKTYVKNCRSSFSLVSLLACFLVVLLSGKLFILNQLRYFRNQLLEQLCIGCGYYPVAYHYAFFEGQVLNLA